MSRNPFNDAQCVLFVAKNPFSPLALERLVSDFGAGFFVGLAGRAVDRSGVLWTIKIPGGSTLVHDQPDGVARLRLPSGDILVARQRDVDTDGPWALSVEFAEHADHRERLAMLHAGFAAGEVAAECRRKCAGCAEVEHTGGLWSGHTCGKAVDIAITAEAR